MRKNQKGFTLIELMIVVAIIGILAAIAIPKFAEMLEKSRDGATKGNIGSVKSAISIYYGDQEGLWPLDLTYGSATITHPLIFKSKYMDDIPAVKSTAANKLAYPGNGTTFAGNGPGTGGGLPPKTVYYLNYNAAGSDFAAANYGANSTAATNGKGYRYEPTTGLIWVNSTLSDMASKSYTLFGYE